MTIRYEICPVEEVPSGERKIVEIENGKHTIGIFNIDGEFHALANVCPHQLAPLCKGQITGEMTADKVGDFQRIREGEVIRCPWHGWKFDIKTGESVFNPHLKTRTYEAKVENPKECSENNTKECKVALDGNSPPIDKYKVEVEDEIVVLYI